MSLWKGPFPTPFTQEALLSPLSLWSCSTESSAHSLSKVPTQWKQVNLPNHSVFPKVPGRAPGQQQAKPKSCATATPNASSFRKAQLLHSPGAFFLAVFCFSPISKAPGLFCLFPFLSFSFFSSLRSSPERKNKQTKKTSILKHINSATIAASLLLRSRTQVLWQSTRQKAFPTPSQHRKKLT